MISHRRIGAVTTLSFLLACSGSGGGPDGGAPGLPNDGGVSDAGTDGGSPTLTVSPSTATVNAGGPSANFSATLTGSSNAISWTLAGPGSIAPTTGATTTYTPPSTVAAPTSAILTATAGAGLTSAATVTINPPVANAVSGTVIDQFHRGVSGATVIIGSQTTVTGPGGAFTVANVDTPYDLIAVTPGPNRFASVYKGLTRVDPIIWLYGISAPPSRSAILLGTLSGGDDVSTSGDITALTFGAPEFIASRQLITNPWNFSLSWLGPASTTGTLRALQWPLASNGYPSSYSGFGVKTGISLTNGVETLGADIAMTAPSSEMITGTITLPASYQLSFKQIRAIFDDGSGVTLAENASTSFALPFPSGIGATGTVFASAVGLGVGNTIRATLRGVNPGTLNVMLELPEGVAALLPDNTAQGITTDTEFSWTPFVDGLHMVSFTPMSAGPTYFVFTMGASAKIPDLTAQGAGLPASRDYVWSVGAFGPWESIDAVAGGQTFDPAGPVVYESGAAARQFTTHP